MMAKDIPQRKIGDAPVSPMGLGCMGLSLGPPGQDEEHMKLLTAAADMGITFWDTSPHYGDNEKLIGRWFKETGRRDEIFLATKFGFKMLDGKPTFCSTPEHVKESCAASLERLKTDRIDLLYQSRVDKNTPIEKTVEAMVELKKEGKIRYLGLSECSARTLRRACAVHPIAAAEMEFSPFALDIEDPQIDFLRTARELGVKIVAYSPLGRGFLTGAIRSRTDIEAHPVLKMHPRFSEENFASNLKLVKSLEKLANEKGCSTSQLSLAWLMHQGEGKEFSIWHCSSQYWDHGQLLIVKSAL